MSSIYEDADFARVQPPTHESRARAAQVNAVHRANDREYRDAEVQALLAQSAATLALVEQQRIANLIALAGLPKLDGFETEVYDARLEALMEGLLDREEVAAVPGYGPAGIDEQTFIRDDIKKSLRLS